METRTAGAEGGPGKRAGSNSGTAPRSDPYYNARLCCSGNEYAKAMAARAGIGFTALDNGFAAVDDVAKVQAICDSFGERVIWDLAAKWMAILPCPFTAEDAAAGYR